MQFKVFVGIIRPANCAMALVAVLAGYAIAGGKTWSEPALWLAMAAAFLICAAGQAINDFFDVKIDRKIRPQKALASQKISMRAVLFFSIALFFSGILFAAMINQVASIIAIVFSALLILYSALIQKQKFIGNIVVSLGTAFTFVFGASIVQNYSTVVFVAASAFFASMGREITKDTQDKKADEGFKKTLPMMLPQKLVNALVLAFYFLGFLMAVIAFTAGLFRGTVFALLLLVSGTVFFYSFLLLNSNNPGKAQKFSKIAMGISLAAFLAGALQ